jgi:hypothetical protein
MAELNEAPMFPAPLGSALRSHFFRAILILQYNPPYKTRQPKTNMIHAPIDMITLP